MYPDQHDALPLIGNWTDSKGVKCVLQSVLQRGKWKVSVFSHDILGLEVGEGECMSESG